MNVVENMKNYPIIGNIVDDYKKFGTLSIIIND